MARRYGRRWPDDTGEDGPTIRAGRVQAEGEALRQRSMGIWDVLGHFSHGLVFFTLGLTVSFLHYRSRRILLARHLFWLGAFAIGEALVAWYGLFSSLASGVGVVPGLITLLIRTLSYACLLTFGIQTFVPEEVYQSQVRKSFLILCAVALLPLSIALIVRYPDWESVLVPAESIIHYALAFPGGVLTAVGLRRQSYQSLDAALRIRIRPHLRVIETAMSGYGILNLLLVPPLSVTLIEHLGAPLIDVLRMGWGWAIFGAAITLGLARSLTIIQSEIEQWVEGIEHLQALVEDRERIGRELHDGIIQSIYAAGLLLESVHAMIPTDPERAQAQLGRVVDSLNTTIQDIRRYIFDLRSDMIDDDLRTGIERLLRDFHINTLLETEFEVDGTPRPMHSTARRRHIFQIVREALTNTAKHARARWAKVHLHFGEESLELTISDDGIGMEQLLISKGHGLRNIRERARLLEGTLRIESAVGAGVTYHLTVPYG
jgi:signal transduction histidine kinase